MKTVVIYTRRSTFVARDIELLDADEYRFDNRVPNILLSFVRQAVHFTFKRYDNYLVWFGDYHALIPVIAARIFKRKSFVVVGGFDAISLPEINYGLWHKRGIRLKIVKLAYQLCTEILTVDDSLAENLIRFMPSMDHYKIHTIRTGLDGSGRRDTLLNTRRDTWKNGFLRRLIFTSSGASICASITIGRFI